MTIYRTGGSIGKNNSPTASIATGMWTMDEVELAARASLWPQQIVTSGLVLLLDAGIPHSYPGSGITWTDLSGVGNNGTLVSGPTYSSSNGGTIVFDGVDDYVSGSMTALITNVSLNCWVNIATTSKMGTFVKIGGGTAGFSIGVGTDNTTILGNDVIGLFPGIRFIDTNVSYGTGWKYVTMILSATSVPSIYLNGTLVGSYAGASPIAATNLFYVGSNIGDGVRAYGGNISHVAVYNRVITQTEITQNFNALRNRYGV